MLFFKYRLHLASSLEFSLNVGIENSTRVTAPRIHVKFPQNDTAICRGRWEQFRARTWVSAACATAR
jgi:hypothetical protein